MSVRPATPGASRAEHTLPAQPAAAPPSRTSAELATKYGDVGLDAAVTAFQADRSKNPFKQVASELQADLAAAVADLSAFEEMGKAAGQYGGKTPNEAMEVTGAEVHARHQLLLSAKLLFTQLAHSADTGKLPDHAVIEGLQATFTNAQEQLAQATSTQARTDADIFRTVQLTQWREALRDAPVTDHGGELGRALGALVAFHQSFSRGVPHANRGEEVALANRVLALTERSAAEQTKQFLRARLEAHVAAQAELPEDNRGTTFLVWRDLAVPLRAVAMLEDVASKQAAAAAGSRVSTSAVPTLTGLAAELTRHTASAYLAPTDAAAGALPERTRLCLTTMLAYATAGATQQAGTAGATAGSAPRADDTAGGQTFGPFADLAGAFGELAAALPPEARARIANGFAAARRNVPGLGHVAGIVRTLFKRG